MNGGPTVLSTFSGVGGLDLGLHRAGWSHVGFAEADEYRRAVLAERFPTTPRWSDVRDVGRRYPDHDPYGRAHRISPGHFEVGEGDRGTGGRRDTEPRRVDLLCGGFPCQDLSVAGRRRGLAGERSSGGRVGAERAGEVLAVGSGCGGHPPAGGEEGPGTTGGIADGAGVSRPLTTGTGQRLDYETDDMIVNALDRQAGGPDDNSAQAGHLVGIGASVRRLTPTECERLQGFPDVAKTVRMVVWPSSANRRSDAPAGGPNPNERASVWTADADGSWLSATSAAHSSNMRRLGLDLPVAGSARIDFERDAVRLLSHGSLIGSASGADVLTPSRLRVPAADIARLVALMLRGLETSAPNGRGASPAFSVPSGAHRSGEWLVHLYGEEIEALASDAALFTSTVSACSRSITSAASPSSPSFDSTWRTLFSCVAAATSGCIPGATPTGCSYAFEVVGTSGWTDIPWAGRPHTPDSRRYAACGDAVTVNVAEWLGGRLMAAMRLEVAA